MCLAVMLLIGLLAYDAVKSTPEISKSGIAMGTVVTQKLIGKSAEEAAEKILDKINEIETESLSWRIKSSDIYNINTHAGNTVAVNGKTPDWLQQSLKVCKSSSGAFDITVGKLTALWGIGGENARVPEQAEINVSLSAVGYGKVEINGGEILIAKGQSLDLGAVGKGIACDEAYQVLEMYGIKSAIISVGGSILLFGKNEVNVGIRNPRGEANDYMGILSLKDCCVSTSGDYEKVLTVDGKNYHHILNPKTGYPSDSGLMSVTIVCKSGLLSDALSTACFVLGYEKSLPLLKEYDAEAVFITREKSVYATDGLTGRFEIKDAAYTISETENQP